MTTITTNLTAGAHRPDVYTYAPADAVPDAAILLASTVSGEVDGDAPAVRVAYVNDDEAQFTAEGAEIPEGEPQLAEVLVHTAKITQLVRLSSEQWGQGQTATQLSQSVARAVTRRADLAFLAEPAPTAPAVAPVAGLAHTINLVDGGAIDGNLDALIDLVARLEENLANPSHIIVSPTTWAALRRLKVGGQGVNESLLGAGTNDAQPMLLSLPVLRNRAVPAGTGFVVDKSAIVSAVGTVRVANSEHEYFSSDSVALRATWRIGHAVVRPERIGKFTIAS
ncbi:phage major capsid protein [Mycolicibacterium sp. CBM1]